MVAAASTLPAFGCFIIVCIAAISPTDGRAIAPNDAVRRDGLTVTITGATVDRVPLRSLFDKPEISENESLILPVKLSTDDETRKFNYRSWGGFATDADLTDNFGNRHLAVSFGASKPLGHTEMGAVTARSSVTDVMVFEKPLPRAAYLDLDLPGSNAGVSGTLRFRIPSEAWAR